MNRTARAHLAEIDLPDFGRSEVAPALPAAIYPARLERLRAHASARALGALVIYADREHGASLAMTLAG